MNISESLAELDRLRKETARVRVCRQAVERLVEERRLAWAAHDLYEDSSDSRDQQTCRTLAWRIGEINQELSAL